MLTQCVLVSMVRRGLQHAGVNKNVIKMPVLLIPLDKSTTTSGILFSLAVLVMAPQNGYCGAREGSKKGN